MTAALITRQPPFTQAWRNGHLALRAEAALLGPVTEWHGSELMDLMADATRRS